MNKISRLLVITALSFSVAAPLTACGSSQISEPAPSKKAELNIVEAADSAGQFKTLLAAAKAAGLVETLAGPGPLTVFAPTDDAFAKLPKGTVDSLLLPENKDKLAAILKYHVVSGAVRSTDLSRDTKAPTFQGEELEIKTSTDGVTVNDANVVTADIECVNGVIHIVDSVLLPSPA